ncbi:hypothetical protein MMC18_008605 [Xylographa bjoerkii]|nr:hypothetical protein [Xylographa bjoerkii]
MILDKCILLMVLGSKFISKTWLPSKIRKLHQAIVTFKQYMIEVYEEEKQSIARGEPGSGNLMTSLIHASVGQTILTNRSGQSPSHHQGGLIESEIYGNLFVFNFAGHDTKAHTLAFAVVILASQPLVQDWISEELRHVLGDQQSEFWDYSTIYPKLKQYLAVLLETVRLNTPVPIAKSTGKEPRTLVVGDKSIIIPANILVIPSHVAIHTHPRHWGSDCLEWRPSRRIDSTQPTTASAVKGTIDNEVITTPHKGSFIAWSEGIRNCPGKNFSQVEFVATLACLFRDWRVDPVPESFEDMGMTRKRVMRMVEEDTGQVLLLQLLYP